LEKEVLLLNFQIRVSTPRKILAKTVSINKPKGKKTQQRLGTTKI